MSPRELYLLACIPPQESFPGHTSINKQLMIVIGIPGSQQGPPALPEKLVIRIHGCFGNIPPSCIHAGCRHPAPGGEDVGHVLSMKAETDIDLGKIKSCKLLVITAEVKEGGPPEQTHLCIGNKHVLGTVDAVVLHGNITDKRGPIPG